jgi:hypothetical protein
MTAHLALFLLAAEPAASAVPGLAPVQGNPNLLQAGVPEIPASLRERMAQYQNVRSASLADVSAEPKPVTTSEPSAFIPPNKVTLLIVHPAAGVPSAVVAPVVALYR